MSLSVLWSFMNTHTNINFVKYNFTHCAFASVYMKCLWLIHYCGLYVIVGFVRHLPPAIVSTKVLPQFSRRLYAWGSFIGRGDYFTQGGELLIMGRHCNSGRHFHIVKIYSPSGRVFHGETFTFDTCIPSCYTYESVTVVSTYSRNESRHWFAPLPGNQWETVQMPSNCVKLCGFLERGVR